LQPKKGQNDEGDLSKDTSLKADEYYITYTKETLELVLQSCKDNTGLDLSFIVSNTLLEVTQLRNEYQHMKKILLYCMPDGKGVIIGDTHLNEQKGISHLSLNLVQFINQYVQTHIAEDVSLIKLSEVTGYNPSYLSRLYKEVANENLSAYINRVRFDKAKNLLINSDLNLNEIAAEVGLNSRTYFNRFIKNITGMSPQEYRTHLT
ncbi:MAG: AraC family transcriptional regulator, partial [Clostridia bacterium]|nr:AraC family transcriptional regulator [Clostridia bacterium]